MPVYRFFSLPRDLDTPPTEKTLYNDDVALKSAFKMASLVDGVEVWQGSRLVGQVHAGRPPPAAVTASVDKP